MKFSTRRLALRGLGAAWVASALLACSSAPKAPEPAPLPPDPGLITVQRAWVQTLSPTSRALQADVHGSDLTLAADDGTLLALDARNGQVRWRLALPPLSAGVGGDGQRVAVVSQDNELIVVQAGQALWRSRLGARTLSAPLVAGGRVFVLSADHSLSAFDAASGHKLWQTSRASADALVLQQAGVLRSWGDTLIVGYGGVLAGVSPQAGQVLWEVPVSNARGANDIERLTDLVAPLARKDAQLCARAFQNALACVDAQRGLLQWRKPANGHTGLAGDDLRVFAVESDGRVLALKRADGEPAWVNDSLRWRQLGAPVVLGRSLVVSDAAGWLHLLARADGSLMARIALDGQVPSAEPVLAASTLVVTTRSGQVMGFVAP